MTAVREPYKLFKFAAIALCTIWVAAVLFSFFLALLTPVYTAEEWQEENARGLRITLSKYRKIAAQSAELNRIEHELREIERRLGKMAALPISEAAE
jgi:hypothetical protein